MNESLTEAAATKEIDKLKALCSSQKAEIVKVDVWGNKKFAYTIDYKNSGFYVIFVINANETVPAVLAAAMKVNEKIVRHMFVVLPNVSNKKVRAPKAESDKTDAKAEVKTEAKLDAKPAAKTAAAKTAPAKTTTKKESK